nr:PEF-CTERM sorting domain-containing protein [uncultured Methanolobus sp.]
MQKRNIILGVALVLLLATQCAAGCTSCKFENGCYYITVDGKYYTNGGNTNIIDLGLKINYDDGKTTIVKWYDLGSNPAITLDTSKTVVNVYYDKFCNPYVKIEPVFTANGNEYSPDYIKLYIDQAGPTVSSIKECGFKDYSLSATISRAPCEETDIPEFPSIALPIAAVIGLAFVFMRKKEN